MSVSMLAVSSVADFKTNILTINQNSALCLNTDGSFSCMCNEGYTGSGLNCTDVNECASSPCPKPGICANNPGSFHCICPVGYAFDSVGTCQDVNECIQPTVCMVNTTCTNMDGSFLCACLPGYINQGSACMIDPIPSMEPRSSPCSTNPCHLHASCMANSTRYTCECDAGYVGNGTVCTNENECKIGNHACINSVCIDTDGSYACQCSDHSFVRPCPTGESPD